MISNHIVLSAPIVLPVAVDSTGFSVPTNMMQQPLSSSVLQMSVGPSIFDSPQETTQAPGPDYEMQGQYNVLISYSGTCTDNFSVLGVSPYPVSIRAESVGGPAELRFPVWGEFTPILKPQIAVKFSNPVVIFEDEYQNIPNGPMTPRRSTMVKLQMGVRGGDLGGTLDVSILNGDKLAFLAGDVFWTNSFVIATNETRFWEATFEGVMASSTTNDVKVIATFTENETGIVTVDTNTITVVRIETTVRNHAPREADSHRHVFGIGENVYYAHRPAEAIVSWQFSESGVAVMTAGMFNCPLTVAAQARHIAFRANIESEDVLFSTSFKAYRPLIVARNPGVNDENRESTVQYPIEVENVRFEAGHLMLYVDQYAAPLFISFQRMKIREKSDESQSGGHAGYFDNQAIGGSWSHSVTNGAAAVWAEVDENGQFGFDRAGRPGKYEEPWSDGWKEWPIPMEYCWDESYIVGDLYSGPVTFQRFVIKSNGTFSIRKHGHFAVRNIWGLIWLNGKFETIF